MFCSRCPKSCCLGSPDFGTFSFLNACLFNLYNLVKCLIETLGKIKYVYGKVFLLQAVFILPVIFFPDLSFQAAARIMSSPAYDALKVMKDIAQNFPIRARYDTSACFSNTFFMFVFEFNNSNSDLYPNSAVRYSCFTACQMHSRQFH